MRQPVYVKGQPLLPELPFQISCLTSCWSLPQERCPSSGGGYLVATVVGVVDLFFPHRAQMPPELDIPPFPLLSLPILLLHLLP